MPRLHWTAARLSAGLHFVALMERQPAIADGTGGMLKPLRASSLAPCGAVFLFHGEVELEPLSPNFFQREFFSTSHLFLGRPDFTSHHGRGYPQHTVMTDEVNEWEVESSFIRRIRYARCDSPPNPYWMGKGYLTVEFITGVGYEYSAVPIECVTELLSADNVGGFFERRVARVYWEYQCNRTDASPGYDPAYGTTGRFSKHRNWAAVVKAIEDAKQAAATPEDNTLWVIGKQERVAKWVKKLADNAERERLMAEKREMEIRKKTEELAEETRRRAAFMLKMGWNEARMAKHEKRCKENEEGESSCFIWIWLASVMAVICYWMFFADRFSSPASKSHGSDIEWQVWLSLLFTIIPFGPGLIARLYIWLRSLCYKHILKLPVFLPRPSPSTTQQIETNRVAWHKNQDDLLPPATPCDDSASAPPEAPFTTEASFIPPPQMPKADSTVEQWNYDYEPPRAPTPEEQAPEAPRPLTPEQIANQKQNTAEYLDAKTLYDSGQPIAPAIVQHFGLAALPEPITAEDTAKAQPVEQEDEDKDFEPVEVAGEMLEIEDTAKPKRTQSRFPNKPAAPGKIRVDQTAAKATQPPDEPRVFRDELFDGGLFPESPPKTPTRKRAERNMATEASADPTPAMEGERAALTRYAPVRDPKLRKAAIHLHGRNCCVCSASFDKTYGRKLARGYIEVHHLKSIAHGERETNPATDLAPLCANCHRMADRLARESDSPPQTIEELKRALIPRSAQTSADEKPTT